MPAMLLQSVTALFVIVNCCLLGDDIRSDNGPYMAEATAFRSNTGFDIPGTIIIGSDNFST
jgi:hypothetical protein